MAKRRSPEVPALPIPKKRRSGFHDNIYNYGPIPSPTSATMRTSTRAIATATGEAIVTGTPAPVVKGKEVATSSGNNVAVLANSSLTFEAMRTLANYMLTYVSGLETLNQDFSEAIRNYASGQEELAHKFKMGTEEVLRLYLPER